MNDFPKRTTLRSKRNLKRKIRRVVRIINKQLRADVFGDRFSLVIVGSNIVPYDDNSGWDAHFLIEFRDAKCPERNYIEWFDPYDIIYSGLFVGGRHMDAVLNDFIIRSDFWTTLKPEDVAD